MMNKGDPFEHSLRLEVPFENSRQADVARKVLLPDPIMKPEDFHVRYSAQDSKLVCEFESVDERILRVGVNSVIESIKTIIETMDELC
ncbi:EKC/KEOPS complex subunit [Kluyveromyces marxianus]|nr:EKC/KEOPS complex subunit [Kluyveromyces marxianus]